MAQRYNAPNNFCGNIFASALRFQSQPKKYLFVVCSTHYNNTAVACTIKDNLVNL